MCVVIENRLVFVFVGLWWDWMDIVLSGCKHGKVDNSWSCSSLSESDPKIYTNIEFNEIEIHKYLENICIYKAKQILFT